MRHKTMTWPLAVIALVALLASACSSSTGSASAGSPAPSSSRALSGTPVNLMLIIDLSGDAGALRPFLGVYQATVQQINATGGIDGRPLKMDVCDAASDASAALACAQKAVAGHFPAVLNGSFESTVDPLLQRYGIPDLGDALSVPGQYTLPISFPMWAGGLGNIAGMGTEAALLHCRQAQFLGSFPTGLVPVLTPTYDQFKLVASGHGVKVGPLVQIPYSTADFTSFVAKAVQQGADCLALEGVESSEVGIIRAAREVAPQVKLITATGLVDAASAQSLGSLLNNVYAVSIAEPSSAAANNALVQQWVNTVKRYSSSQTFLVQSANAWASVKLFAYLAGHVSTISSKTIFAAANKLQGYQSGVFPPLSFNQPVKNPLGPRVFNPYILIGDYNNGQFVPNSMGFVNIYTLSKAPAS